MGNEITLQAKDEFMQDKLTYDSLSQAIRLAKSNGIEEKKIKPLTMLKQSMKSKCADNVERILRKMPLSQNVLHLDDSWYAIRYINDKGNTQLKIDIINECDLYVIKRDGRHERELSRVDLDTLLPGIIAEEKLDKYKRKLQVEARRLVLEHLNIDLFEDEEPVEEQAEQINKPVTVSFHAAVRWLQRVMKMYEKDDTKAETYLRDNPSVHADINKQALELYGLSEVVWSDEDIQYCYHEENNLMFVYGNSKIITLYPEDFGFALELNRVIVRKQLEVLEDAHVLLLHHESIHNNNVNAVESEIIDINNEIAVLEAQISSLVAKRGTLVASREESLKGVKLAKAKFNAEFDKLFKKWDN